jgi:hypothetical protein
MKINHFIFFALILLTISCKNEEEELKEKMIPVLTKITLQDSLVAKLDSIIIYKLDTLTDLNAAMRRLTMLNNLSDHYIRLAKFDTEMAELHQSSGKSRTSSASLYYSVLDSKTLGDIEIGEAKEYFEKSRESVKHSKLMLDSSTLMSNMASKILLDVKQKKIDSLSFRGYIPHYIVKGADKEGVQVADSMFVFLSKDLHIIRVKALN